MRPSQISFLSLALVFLSMTSAILLTVSPVKATTGLTPNDPGNVWAPYGPIVKKLQLQYYNNEFEEFNDFTAGHIDIVDWPAPQSLFNSWSNNPDYLLTPIQGEGGGYAIIYNGASSTWKNWGCDWAANYDTTVVNTPLGLDVAKPTVPNPQIYNNTRHVDSRGIACDVNIRQGFAHLFDRPRWVLDGILQGTAQALADRSTPTHAPSASSLSEQCTWDRMFPNCITAFRIAESPGGFAQPGSADFCAAADHMIAAGVATGAQGQLDARGLHIPGTGSCMLTGVNPEVFIHPMRFMIRNDHQPRLQMGNGLMNAINQLFGGNAVKPTYGNVRQIGIPIVFSEPPTSPVDDWDGYTFASSQPGFFADIYYPFYNSVGAGDFCGDLQTDFPDAVQFVCNKAVDDATNAAKQATDILTFNAATIKVMSLLGHLGADIPVFAFGIRTVALRSVAGLVNQLGSGYSNFYTTLTAHSNSSFVPSDPRYAFGGGDPSTLRWGQASGTSNLNVFRAQSIWELNAIGEVYDTLFSINPVDFGQPFCWMCNSASTIATAPFVAGDTIFDVILRPNLRWHDGQQVTAHDVAFSALNLGRYSPVLGGIIRQGLRGVKVISDTEVYIEWQGQSVSWPVNMAFFTIIPSHLWEDLSLSPPPSCANLGCVWGSGQGTTGDSNLIANDIHPVRTAMVSPSYDPVIQSTFIGSGPFMCRSLFPVDYGKIGTGCSVNPGGVRAGQATAGGGSLILQAFDRTNEAGIIDPYLQYMRSYNSQWATQPGTAAHSGLFQEFRWADRYNNATVTVRDLVSVAGCYGATGPRTNCPASEYNYWHRSTFENIPGTISGEVAIVAAHLDETWVYPFSWSGDQSAQPGPTLQNIIPFNQP